MNLNSYQEHALSTRLETADEAYIMANLPSEVGEFFGHAAKMIRDGVDEFETRTLMLKELGDILWNITLLAVDLDSSLDEIATMNVHKRESRKLRDTLGGNGDNR